jgi:hypothetical protein
VVTQESSNTPAQPNCCCGSPHRRLCMNTPPERCFNRYLSAGVFGLFLSRQSRTNCQCDLPTGILPNSPYAFAEASELVCCPRSVCCCLLYSRNQTASALLYSNASRTSLLASTGSSMSSISSKRSSRTVTCLAMAHIKHTAPVAKDR